jgi:cytochrome c-type biogenesis protein CcmE
VAGLKKKRRIQLIVIGFVLIAGAAAAIGYGFREGIELYRSPSQIAEHPPVPGERFRLGGMVVEGSWQKGETHRFVITDYESEYPVVYKGIVPDLFSEGSGTIVTGTIEDGVFVATEVLAKHDESYMPKEVADTLREPGS